MRTGELRSQVDRIWGAFAAGGISSQLEVIEQITYLLFRPPLNEEGNAMKNRTVLLVVAAAEIYRQETGRLRRRALIWAGALATHEAEAVLRSFVSVIGPAAWTGRRESLEKSAVSPLGHESTESPELPAGRRRGRGVCRRCRADRSRGLAGVRARSRS